MTNRIRLLLAGLALAFGLSAVAVSVDSPVTGTAKPAAATTYQAKCNSTSGSPYVERYATSTTSPLQANINCVRALGAARWGYSTCVANAVVWYYSNGYYYGEATKKQIEFCGYNAASFTTRGALWSYW
jgi:hypothetical protein